MHLSVLLLGQGGGLPRPVAQVPVAAGGLRPTFRPNWVSSERLVRQERVPGDQRTSVGNLHCTLFSTHQSHLFPLVHTTKLVHIVPFSTC